MDTSAFAHLARSLRTRRTFAAALGVAALTNLSADAKKRRKKPCAKKCRDGCCTGKKGKCIRPAQQSKTRCGTNGEICRTTNCAGVCANCGCSADTAPCPTGQCCRGDGACGACLAFVSNTSYLGNLGGLAGADTKCQTSAAAANLPGVYLSWLSDPTGSPSTRFTRATAPYVLPDGSVIAQDWNALTDGSLDHALNVTETGLTLSTETYVWTDTRVNGSLDSSTSHCNQWSQDTNAFEGNVGRTSATTGSWTRDGPAQCGYAKRRLYCFQQR